MLVKTTKLALTDDGFLGFPDNVFKILVEIDEDYTGNEYAQVIACPRGKIDPNEVVEY